jgi:hypothetical protein
MWAIRADVLGGGPEVTQLSRPGGRFCDILSRNRRNGPERHAQSLGFATNCRETQSATGVRRTRPPAHHALELIGALFLGRVPFLLSGRIPATRVCNLPTLSRTFHCACRAGPARR